MTRVETVHGSFEVPAGWTVLDGEGAADGPLVEGEARRTLTVYGDRAIEGRGPAAYMALQPELLAGTIPGYVRGECRALSEDEQGPWLLAHRIEAPGEIALAQWQVFVFEGERIGVLTATADAAAPGDVTEHLFRALASFAFPPAVSAHEDELHDHDHGGDEEHRHDGDDHAASSLVGVRG